MVTANICCHVATINLLSGALLLIWTYYGVSKRDRLPAWVRHHIVYVDIFEGNESIICANGDYSWLGYICRIPWIMLKCTSSIRQSEFPTWEQMLFLQSQFFHRSIHTGWRQQTTAVRRSTRSLQHCRCKNAWMDSHAIGKLLSVTFIQTTIPTRLCPDKVISTLETEMTLSWEIVIWISLQNAYNWAAVHFAMWCGITRWTPHCS